MGKRIRLLILFLTLILILPFIEGKSLNINPSIIDRTYSIGSSQPSNIQINFQNNDFTNFTLSLSKSGTSSNFFSLSGNSLSFSGISNNNITISFNIPQTTQIGLYSGEIIYDSGANDKIPVYVNIIKNVTTGCRLIIPFTDYEYAIKIGTSPNTQDFLVKVSSECSQAFQLTELRTTGVILTDSSSDI